MPMVDARLPDGSRLNAIIPPLCLNGPTLTIRKFFKQPLTVHDLIARGSASPEMMEFLRVCVQGRLNIIVSGGTGTGKTTILNVLSSFIPPDERIVTIENAAELRLQQRHVVQNPANDTDIRNRVRTELNRLQPPVTDAMITIARSQCNTNTPQARIEIRYPFQPLFFNIGPLGNLPLNSETTVPFIGGC